MLKLLTSQLIRGDFLTEEIKLREIWSSNKVNAYLDQIEWKEEDYNIVDTKLVEQNNRNSPSLKLVNPFDNKIIEMMKKYTINYLNTTESAKSKEKNLKLLNYGSKYPVNIDHKFKWRLIYLLLLFNFHCSNVITLTFQL